MRGKAHQTFDRCGEKLPYNYANQANIISSQLSHRDGTLTPVYQSRFTERRLIERRFIEAVLLNDMVSGQIVSRFCKYSSFIVFLFPLKNRNIVLLFYFFIFIFVFVGTSDLFR